MLVRPTQKCSPRPNAKWGDVRPSVASDSNNAGAGAPGAGRSAAAHINMTRLVAGISTPPRGESARASVEELERPVGDVSAIPD